MSTEQQLIEKAARAGRAATKIGPLGPNTLDIVNRGGWTQLNSSEAEEFAAAVIDAVRADIAAEALREAADEVPYVPNVDRWLRERADALTTSSPSTFTPATGQAEEEA